VLYTLIRFSLEYHRKKGKSSTTLVRRGTVWYIVGRMNTGGGTMKKKTLAALMLALLTVLSFTGCGGKTQALTRQPWQRLEYLPAATAGEVLAALDLAPEEIARADLNRLALLRTAEFTAKGDFRFGCSGEGTKMLARQYLDTLFSALAADPAPLAPLYDEGWQVDMAAMTAEECKAFYAELFGCGDYDALLDHLSAALFDYEALARQGESGHFDRRGDRLFLTDETGGELGYVEFSLGDSSLTLYFAQATQEYTPA